MFGEFLKWIAIPFVLSTIYLDEKVKMSTTSQTNTMETEPLTRGIVIFGATGDLCKKKLIPALFKLWQKGLLPDNYLIMGSARREPNSRRLEKVFR